MHFTRTHLNGNPYLGIFAMANESYLLHPRGAQKKVIREISGTLEVEPLGTSIGGTEIIGTFAVANSRGLLLPVDATSRELGMVEESLDLQVEIIETRYNALGNLILANDSGAIVGDIFDREEISKISDTLDVDVEPGTVNGLSIVGSLGRASNAGALVSPKATDEEIKLIKDVLQVEVDRGTANFGVGNVGTCMLVNSKGVAAGTPTSGIEMGKIQQVFEEGAW
jgi:translation initiation factor 6